MVLFPVSVPPLSWTQSKRTAGMVEIIRSNLKLQSLDDASGFYEWKKKHFTLDITSSMLSSVSAEESGNTYATSASIDGQATVTSPNGQKGTEFTISGAVCSKEWTLSSPVAGYGFDLVWASGKIWSFLAEDEQTCSLWVESLNRSIQIAKERSRDATSQPATDETTLLQSPGDLVERYNTCGDSTIDQSKKRSPTRSSQSTNSHQLKTPEKLKTPPKKSASFQQLDSEDEASSLGKRTGNISSIPVIDSSSGSGGSPESEISCGPHDQREGTPQPRRSTPPRRHASPPPPPSTLNPAIDSKAYEELKLKYSELQRESMRDKAETGVLRDRISRLQEEMEVRQSLMEDELKDTWEKYRADNQGIRSDIEERLRRSENNFNSIHEAEMHSLKEQHTREATSLREELAAERKRYASTSGRDKDLIADLRANESELRFELGTVNDKFQRLESEVIKLREFSRLESNRWQLEKADMTTEYERCIQELTGERDALQLRCQQEIRAKVAEINEKFSGTVRDIEASSLETMRKQLESEKFHAISQIQKQCTRDIESVRAEEKKNSTREIENLRKLFLTREKQTAEDLTHLESLHEERVQGLEKLITDLKAQVKGQENLLRGALHDRDCSVMETQHAAHSYSRNLDEHVQRGHKLGLELKEAHQEIQASRHRETDYREKLSNAIEEARILQAEMAELKRQASESAAEAYSWKRAAQESDSNRITEKSTLQIAKDEVTMLEHEIRRVREENWTLQQRVNKLMHHHQSISPRKTGTAKQSSHSSPSQTRSSSHNRESANAASPSATLTYQFYPQQTSFPPAASVPASGSIKTPQHPGWFPAGKSTALYGRALSPSPTKVQGVNMNVNSSSKKGNRAKSPALHNRCIEEPTFKPDLSATARYRPTHRF